MNFDPQTVRVALLAGGTSDEREISLASGQGALRALRAAGFQVSEFDPAKHDDLVKLITEDFDVAFLCMHGKKGEDGVLQGFLEMIELPYIGSDVCSSAIAMDKARAKVFYHDADIRTPESITLYRGHSYQVDEICKVLGDSCVVKPGTEGSALGVYVVSGVQEIEKAIHEAFRLDSEILVERFVKGTEVTVAVLGNDELQALPVIQIVPRNEFYDFESKYAPNGSQHICPAPLDESTTKTVQDMAVQAHKVLGCSGLSRSDFIIDEANQCWILETNTLPGMTETSLLPDAGRAAGIEFPDLCAKLIELALEKKS